MSTPSTRPPIVTVHFWGIESQAIAGALLRMASGRRSLRHVPGLRFARLVGTGSGRTFSVRDADFHHWGLITSWNTLADAETFEQSNYMSTWERRSFQTARFVLDPIHSRGQWSGKEPFSPSSRAAKSNTSPSVGSASDGRIAAITRARIPMRHWRRFANAVPPVAAATTNVPGLIVKTGIGEAPIGLQGTFSLWETANDLRVFSSGPAHQHVIDETQRVAWYSEELFARFRVIEASGSFGNVDVARSNVAGEGD